MSTNSTGIYLLILEAENLSLKPEWATRTSLANLKLRDIIQNSSDTTASILDGKLFNYSTNALILKSNDTLITWTSIKSRFEFTVSD